MKEIYDAVCEIQKLLWKNDDLMDQETLFDVQDKVAGLALKVASRANAVDDLVGRFPWLYVVKEA